ncbi:protein of unknown function [Taphrina deformans PYCC 5710]|uniref:Dihydrodipicolinate synthase n=1 Tax=Taphrina deformans (strain PYCC 5710 / ATCC 11124 / CBS 356.35 / IMI 108563 / JCM 9778 / NBRC 8474) TaxID=1097556 RepID=R4XB15_TAPDE|nr:protein of unknown function [Taphrina deformans PYCC 5710]|eukprot:CCG80508.1 protein of unknown function [Taphrina deformans PYCC 5710]
MEGTFKARFRCWSAAFLAAARTAGAVGAIISLSNVFPYTLVKLYNLIESGASETEVLRLQSLVTNYEEIMTTASVPGIRATMGLLGLPAGHSRKPLPDASPAEIDHLKRHIVDIAAEENRLRELVQAASEGNE